MKELKKGDVVEFTNELGESEIAIITEESPTHASGYCDLLVEAPSTYRLHESRLEKLGDLNVFELIEKAIGE